MQFTHSRASDFQLIPHADVIFLNKHYALAHSRDYATSPRAFLLSLTHIAPPHALLVAHWGSEGAAVLSVPTKEYFQSSGWVEPPRPDSLATSPNPPTHRDLHDDQGSENEVESVRSGSTFWAGAGHDTESSSEFTTGNQRLSSLTSSSDPSSNATPRRTARHRSRHHRHAQDDDSSSSDSDGTQIAGQNGRGSNSSAGNNPQTRPQTRPDANSAVDEVGASDAFIAGMMYALTRRMLPGEPYTPSAVRKNRDGAVTGVAGANGTVRGAPSGAANLAADLDMLRGRWRLEECLRLVPVSHVAY